MRAARKAADSSSSSERRSSGRKGRSFMPSGHLGRRLDRQSVPGVRRPRRGDEPGLRGQRPPGRGRAQGRCPQDPASELMQKPHPDQPVRRGVPDLGPARRASEHRPGPLGRDHRRPALRGAGADAGGRPAPMDRHAPAGPAAGAAVRLPVLRRDGARPAPGAALPPRHQAGQPAGDRGGDAQDHRFRAGAGLRGDGGHAARAARRLDPAGRAHHPAGDHLDRSARPGRRRREAGPATAVAASRPERSRPWPTRSPEDGDGRPVRMPDAGPLRPRSRPRPSRRPRSTTWRRRPPIPA